MPVFEINLIPDLKAAILKTQRIRNIVFIVCVLIMVGMGIAVAVLFSVKLVQDVQMGEQADRLKLMSQTINNYDDLNEFLTMQNQLNNIDKIAKTRSDYSRLLNIINILVPTNGDEISFSEIEFSPIDHSIRFKARADAKVQPLIDYRVLETFKKSMEFMRFDYGEYKNENDMTIPSVCIIESDENGDILKDDETEDLYAIWTKGVNGCDPEDNGEEVTDDDGNTTIVKTEEVNILEEDVLNARDSEESVKIWRTPQLNDWYHGEGEDNYINGGGEISGIEHFESKCIKYELVRQRWTSTNECKLVTEDLDILESWNGIDKDEGGLVLMFTAKLVYNQDSMLIKNKHMNFISPNGYVNVTDSNLQIQNLFKEEAEDCKREDVDCANVEEGGEI